MRLTIGAVLLAVVAVTAQEHTELYERLGISKSANGKQIKRAFRKMSLKWHPDKVRGGEDEEAGAESCVGALAGVRAFPISSSLCLGSTTTSEYSPLLAPFPPAAVSTPSAAVSAVPQTDAPVFK